MKKGILVLFIFVSILSNTLALNELSPEMENLLEGIPHPEYCDSEGTNLLCPTTTPFDNVKIKFLTNITCLSYEKISDCTYGSECNKLIDGFCTSNVKIISNFDTKRAILKTDLSKEDIFETQTEYLENVPEVNTDKVITIVNPLMVDISKCVEKDRFIRYDLTCDYKNEEMIVRGFSIIDMENELMLAIDSQTESNIAMDENNYTYLALIFIIAIILILILKKK